MNKFWLEHLSVAVVLAVLNLIERVLVVFYCSEQQELARVLQERTGVGSFEEYHNYKMNCIRLKPD